MTKVSANIKPMSSVGNKMAEDNDEMKDTITSHDNLHTASRPETTTTESNDTTDTIDAAVAAREKEEEPHVIIQDLLSMPAAPMLLPTNEGSSDYSSDNLNNNKDNDTAHQQQHQQQQETAVAHLDKNDDAGNDNNHTFLVGTTIIKPQLQPQHYCHSVKWEGWYEYSCIGLECQSPYAQLLVTGKKSMDVRQYPLPTPLLQKIVLILQPTTTTTTTAGTSTTATAKNNNNNSQLQDIVTFNPNNNNNTVTCIGWCIFERVMTIKSKAAFDFSHDKHLIPTTPSSQGASDVNFGWTDTSKVLYGWIVKEYGMFDNNKTTTSSSATTDTTAAADKATCSSSSSSLQPLPIPSPPKIEKIIRRMRSCYEVILSPSPTTTTSISNNNSNTSDEQEEQEEISILYNYITKKRELDLQIKREKENNTNNVHASALETINDIVMISDVGQAHSERSSPNWKERLKQKQQQEKEEQKEKNSIGHQQLDNMGGNVDDRGKGSSSSVHDQTLLPRSSNEVFDPPSIQRQTGGRGGGGGEKRRDNKHDTATSSLLEIALRDAESNVLSLSRTNTTLSHQVKQLQENAQLNKLLMNELQSSLDKHVKNNGEVQLENKSLNEKLQELQEMISSERLLHQRSMEEYKQAKASWTTDRQEMLIENDAITKELNSIKKTLQDEQSKEGTLMSRLNESKKMEAIKTREGASLRNDLDSIRTKYNHMETNLTHVTKERDSLSSTCDLLKQRSKEVIKHAHDSFEQELKLNEERKIKMKSYVQNKAEELRIAKSSIDSLTRELHELRIVYKDVRERHDEIQHDVQVREEEMMSLRSSVSNMNANNQELQLRETTLKNEITKKNVEIKEHKQRRITAKNELMSVLHTLEMERVSSKDILESVKFTFTPKAISQQQLLRESLESLEVALLRIARRLGKTLPPSDHSNVNALMMNDNDHGGEGGHGIAQFDSSVAHSGGINDTTTARAATDNSSAATKTMNSNNKSTASKRQQQGGGSGGGEWDTVRLLSNLEFETKNVSQGIMTLTSSLERLHVVLDDQGERTCVSSLADLLSGRYNAQHGVVGGVAGGVGVGAGGSVGRYNSVPSHGSSHTRP